MDIYFSFWKTENRLQSLKDFSDQILVNIFDVKSRITFWRDIITHNQSEICYKIPVFLGW